MPSTTNRAEVYRRYAHKKARRLDSVCKFIKLWYGCRDCGYRDHPEALDFDHRPDEVKLFNIARSRNSHGLNAVLVEIAKCDVRCANCHRVKTAERR